MTTRRSVQLTSRFLAIAAALGVTAATAHAQTTARSHFVEVDDIRVHYLDYGPERERGSTIVLLHGGFGTTALWGPVGRQLARCHRVIIPDLRGRGLTSVGTGPLTAGRIARDTIGLLDHLGISKAHVVGHSAGSIALLALTVDYRDRLLSATLVGSPAAALHAPSARLMALNEDLQRLGDGIEPRDPELAAFRARWRRTAPEPERFEVLIGRMIDARTATYPLTAAARRVPTLVVRARQDALIPESSFTELAGALGTEAIVDYPDGTHGLPREHPEALARDVERFVSGVDLEPCAESATD